MAHEEPGLEIEGDGVSDGPSDRYPEAEYVLGLISTTDFGERDRYNNIRKANLNRKVVRFARRRELGINARGLKKLDARMLVEHAEGVRTLYCTADGEANHLLLAHDADNHCNAGTYEDASRCLAASLPPFLEGTFIEPSTNGRGAHGYWLLENPRDPGLLKKALKHYFAYLDWKRQEGVDRGLWNVEKIEFKGQPGRLVRSGDGTACRNISGQLIKVPRGFRDRFDEFQKIPVVTVDQLLSLEIPGVAKEAAKKREHGGSAGGDIFTQEELGRLQAAYRDFAGKLLAGREIAVTNRCVVATEDVAIFLMILLHFRKRRNADHTLPTKRWESLWSALYGAKAIDRAWHSGRFKAIRDLFDQAGYLEWEDESYVVGIWVEGDKEGDKAKYMKGRAAKWDASEKLVKELERDALIEYQPQPASGPNNPNSLYVSTILPPSPRPGILATIDWRRPIKRPRFAGFIYGRRLLAA